MSSQGKKKFYISPETFEEFKRHVLHDITVSFRDPQIDYEPLRTLFGLPIVVDDSLPKDTVMVMQDNSKNNVLAKFARICVCNHLEEHHATGSVCVLGNCACQRFKLGKVHPLPQANQLTYRGKTENGGEPYTNFNAVEPPFDYDTFLKNIVSLPAMNDKPIKYESHEKPVNEDQPPVKVVKRQKERKLALDKDI